MPALSEPEQNSILINRAFEVPNLIENWTWNNTPQNYDHTVLRQNIIDMLRIIRRSSAGELTWADFQFWCWEGRQKVCDRPDLDFTQLCHMTTMIYLTSYVIKLHRKYAMEKIKTFHNYYDPVDLFTDFQEDCTNLINTALEECITAHGFGVNETLIYFPSTENNIEFESSESDNNSDAETVIAE